MAGPNQSDVEQRPSIAKGLLSFIPGPGDAIAAHDAYQDARKGDYLGAALNGVGLLPFIPAIGGMIKTPVGRIPETASETRSLADMLQRAGERAGYQVSRSDSAISPSRYVTFQRAGDDIGDSIRQVRISNHQDKYPELASGTRTSVDPNTKVSFEQAVNWLGREGFPTSLSSKYKNIPTWDHYYETKRVMDSSKEVRLQRLQAAWLNQPKATRGPRPTLNDLE